VIYIIVFICAAHLPHQECNTKTARAYRAYTERGFVCGLPNQMGQIASSPIAPREDEYLKIQCRVDRHL
jgi:hypothetical protein